MGDDDAGNEGVVVRACRLEDLLEIKKILGQAPEAAAWSDESLVEATRKAGHEFLVARMNDRVSGFVVGSTVLGEAEILNLAVRPGNRRMGVATSLVTALMDGYLLAGVRKFFLEVRESNRGAIAFYEGLGFREVGRRADYYRDPTEAALVFSREA
jgi:ribosomal-protein-alanine N-acetyltransferase